MRSATWKYLKNIMQNEICQSQKNIYDSIYVTFEKAKPQRQKIGPLVAWGRDQELTANRHEGTF